MTQTLKAVSSSQATKTADPGLQDLEASQVGGAELNKRSQEKLAFHTTSDGHDPSPP